MEENYKRYIFLDVDGVVNSYKWYNTTRGLEGDVDPKTVQFLNRLKSLNPEIVLTTSWTMETASKMLKEKGLEIPIIGETEHFHTDWFCRGNEVNKWLIDNCGGFGTKWDKIEWGEFNGVPCYRVNCNVEYEYVIFDDASDFLLNQKDHFIHVNEEVGITEEDINKAIDILTRKEYIKNKN